MATPGARTPIAHMMNMRVRVLRFPRSFPRPFPPRQRQHRLNNQLLQAMEVFHYFFIAHVLRYLQRFAGVVHPTPGKPTGTPRHPLYARPPLIRQQAFRTLATARIGLAVRTQDDADITQPGETEPEPVENEPVQPGPAPVDPVEPAPVDPTPEPTPAPTPTPVPIEVISVCPASSLLGAKAQAPITQYQQCFAARMNKHHGDRERHGGFVAPYTSASAESRALHFGIGLPIFVLIACLVMACKCRKWRRREEAARLAREQAARGPQAVIAVPVASSSNASAPPMPVAHVYAPNAPTQLYSPGQAVEMRSLPTPTTVQLPSGVQIAPTLRYEPLYPAVARSGYAPVSQSD
jgi:hypothetical protein